MNWFFYVMLGVLVGLVFRGATTGRAPLNIGADLLLGVLGSWTGAFMAAFFDSEFRIFPVDGAGIGLAVLGAVTVLYTARLVSLVPEDA